MSVIDGTTNTVTATIPVGTHPSGVGVDPSSHTVYVANALSGTVSVIDGTSNTVTESVAIDGGAPDAVAVDPSTHTVYVTNNQIGGTTVGVIDGITNTVTATVAVPGAESQGIEVDPSSHTAYVTNATNPGTVSVIDGASNTVTATVAVGMSPVGIGVDPSSHIAYVANSGDSTVSVLDVADQDLAIGTHADVTVNATGPSGAAVTYAAPPVTDADDSSAPAAACTPASGTTFPIGTTTVTCTATDADDTNSPVSSTFVITVVGADGQLANLAQAVQGVGPGTSLADKVHATQSSLSAGDAPDACRTLAAFVREVSAQAGKSIPAAKATQLIQAAQQIQAVLGC